MSELTELPERFAAGTTVSYRRSDPDHPASAGWSLKLYLAGPSELNVAAVASGDEFVITLTATATAALASGTYRYDELATKSPEMVSVASGTVIVDPNLATATGGALQDEDERELADVRARITTITQSGVQTYQVDGTSVMHPELPGLYRRERELRRRIEHRRNPGVFAVTQNIRTVRLGGH